MKKIGFIVLLLASVGFQGCKKEGCTINTALNFDEKAKENDGSCQFTGDVYTYMSSMTRNNLLDDGIDFISVYIDGSFVDVINVNAYSLTGQIPCNASNAAVKSMSWVGDVSKTFQVDFRDQSTGLLVKTINSTVNTNQCNAMGLSY